jgi:hypothetical protein
MASYRRVLNVFLASPGDLESERRASKEVVDEVAMTARELGVSLELLGWEDTLPGAQRPQDAINADLDAADLVVGLLWRRWGQPTGHAEYTSGFEEEFERAFQRRTSSGSPEIWLFFKDVEAALRQDPGEQLQKVLLFRQRCETEKKIFFKQFTTTDDWPRTFRQHLSRYVVRFAGGPTTEPVGEGFGGSVQPEAKPPGLTASGEAAPSLLPLAEILTDIANGGDPQTHATKDAGLQSARLYLLGLSLLAESGTSSDFANTHETNTLYRLRTQFDPIPIERDLLQRTRLADQVDVKPGWYWFPRERDLQLDLIAYHAIADGEPDVRKNALALLTASRVRRDEWSDVFFSGKTANSQPAEVDDAFWKYLEAVVIASDLDRLNAMRESARSMDRVNSLVLVARAQLEPGPVLAEVAASPTEPSQRLLEEISARVGEIDATVLTAAFATRHAPLRNVIAVELERRGQLNDIRDAARADSSETIRVLEYRDRLRNAAAVGTERPPLPENLSYDAQRWLAVERLRGLPVEQLRQRIDWFNVENSAAYEVLATDHWEEMKDEIRADLSDGFERIRKPSLERYAQSVSQQIGLADLPAIKKAALEAIEKQLAGNIDAFSRRQFAAAALAGIARHGSGEDAASVRPFLKDSLDRETAVRALARIGNQEDVPALLRVATEAYGNAKLEAAKVVLRLSDSSEEVIQSLFQSKDVDLVRLALNALRESASEALPSTLMTLLNDENNSTRVLAARFLAKLVNPDQLLEVLDTYVGQSQYYYNVVVAFDRDLYCRLPPHE